MSDALAQNDLMKKDRVTGKVVKTSLAGVVVDLGSGKLGVVPISQMGKGGVRNLEGSLKEGEEITAWVSRLTDSGRIELTLVEPLTYEWRDLKPEMTVSGRVSKLEKFGAFVDIGAERPGLLHVSELAREYIKSPEDKVKVGDEIQVKVLEVDRRKKQIKLSMKALLPEPRKIDKMLSPVEEPAEEPEKPVPTAMEVALRKAMDSDANHLGQQAQKAKGEVRDRSDMEEILSRTLENRVRSK
jgi:small subunit ribosomal protein S1